MSQVYKELKILKVPDLLYPKICLFMSKIETNQGLGNSFIDLGQYGYKQNYLTKSNAKVLFDIPFLNTQIYDTQSVRYNCKRD